MSGLALMCILLIGRCTWTKQHLIFMSAMFLMLQTDMGEIGKTKWKNLDLNFQIRKRRDQRQITARLFDSACRTMFLDICKRHGLELDEEQAYGGRAYLEKQDFIRMKQKEEIAHQDNMIEEQERKRVNENILQIVQQTRTVQEK